MVADTGMVEAGWQRDASLIGCNAKLIVLPPSSLKVSLGGGEWPGWVVSFFLLPSQFYTPQGCSLLLVILITIQLTALVYLSKGINSPILVFLTIAFVESCLHRCTESHFAVLMEASWLIIPTKYGINPTKAAPSR